MTTPDSTKPKRTSWLRRLAWFSAIFVVVLVVAYFVLTSGAFFKGVILPRVGQAMNAKVTATDASISPFSAVTLKGLSVQTTGPDPVLTVDEVRLRYSLLAILGGTLKVDEVALVNPKVHVVQNADGTSNLDPLTKGSETKPKEESIPVVAIGKIELQNGQVHVLQKLAAGGESRVTLEKLNFNLSDIRNGQTARLNLDGTARWYSGTATSNNTADAALKSDLSIGLTPQLGLASAKGDATVSVGSATGAMAQLSGFRSVLAFEVTPTEFKQFAWRAFNGARLLAEMTVTGQLDLTKKEGALDLALTNLNLADWKAFVPETDPVGMISAQGRITARDAGRLVGFDWRTTWQDVGARVGTNRVDQIGGTLAASGSVTNFNRVKLDRAELSLTHQTQPAARLSAMGQMELEPQSAALQLGADLDLARLCQIVPQPDMKVETGQVRLLNAQVQHEGNRQTISGGLILTNLTGTVAGTALKDFAVGAGYDLSATDGTVIDLRRLALSLAETARAKVNQLELSGRVDLTRTNAIEGDLKLAAETLDLTPYYDLVAGQTPTSSGQTTPGKPSTPTTSTSTNAPAEPDPIQLPVRQFVVAARIGRLWLREVEATQVVATVKIESNRVTIRPMSLAMNGAPLSAELDLDLSVSGWRYAVKYNAAGLPIAPLADSFVPEYRGRAKGELWADCKLDGAGVTGPSLRKNLVGNLGFSLTNADIQIVGPRLKGFLTPIAVALNAPGLLNSPLNWAAFGASMGSGKASVSQLALISPAFAAATHGEVALGDSLKSSRLSGWPMAFQLDRALADRLQLSPKDTPTNATKVALPPFIKVKGTADAPAPEIDLKSLAGAALMKYADKIPGLDERTSGLLKGAAGLLTGASANPTNNAAGTNSPAKTNAPGAGLLDLLKRPKSK